MRIRSFLFAALVPACAAAQQTNVTPAMRQYVSVEDPVVALTHVRLIDGTGTPAKNDQTVIIEGQKIREVGPSASVRVPANARVLDLTGHTVIPGLVGLHDHMYYSSRPMLFSYPKLFLAAGVTTIRTTGSYDSYQELNLKRNIELGQAVGPTIYVTGPYLQGTPAMVGAMHSLSGADDARRMVKYWAEEGVSWFKAYTTITRAELAAAIDEAHKHGVKVTAHLCSVGFREAVAMGIDNLEHGLTVNTEYYAGKQPDLCPPFGVATDSVQYFNLDINSPQVQQTFKDMIAKNVAMTSTLSVMELSSPTRVPRDQRVLDALYPDASTALSRQWERTATANDTVSRTVLKKSMAYERAFVKAGGLLAAGSDPCCASAIAGYADQRNFELLVEAGFTAEEAVRIMTWNGAKVLGGGEQFGTVQPGRTADLVVLRGDPARTPADIKNVVHVFKNGVGYDPAKLTAAIKGRIGIY